MLLCGQSPLCHPSSTYGYFPSPVCGTLSPGVHAGWNSDPGATEKPEFWRAEEPEQGAQACPDGRLHRAAQALHSFPGRIHVTLEAAACKSPLSAALPRMCRAGGSGLFSKACARCSGSGVKKAAHNPAFMQRVRGKAMTGQNNVHQWQRPCGQPTDLQDRRRGQPQAEIPKRRLAVRRGQC